MAGLRQSCGPVLRENNRCEFPLLDPTFAVWHGAPIQVKEKGGTYVHLDW